MYSRAFPNEHTELPPHYGGTALQGDGRKREQRHEECREPTEKECHEPPRPPHEECGKDHPPPPPERGGILSRLLPFDIKGDDLLLLGIALLLLNEGCEDEYLPLLLLFLLIIH